MKLLGVNIQNFWLEKNSRKPREIFIQKYLGQIGTYIKDVNELYTVHNFLLEFLLFKNNKCVPLFNSFNTKHNGFFDT